MSQGKNTDLAANMWTNPGETAGNGIDDDANGFVDDIHGWDFLHDDNSVYDGPGTNPDGTPVDWHGTHVAGVIGAVGNNGIGIAGINWQVTMVPLKFIGPTGGSTTSLMRSYYRFVVVLPLAGISVKRLLCI
jgi:subtilisin family serine protease